ncbi:extracellular solute-binding protein [Paenibacillus nasutitermitis]|uniref:Sugar ABC transporter permease n=1 Tax=Paenibacillus nasutitermitis TaxID=1652958 RepID=A0A916ZKC1_9BACL|nr:extracellular solute-binding protein [Paenibacillus nasutitermitis]GGE02100.1 sugar ABC transporter permease [Paenibacillus nasutitermitis]
MKKNWTNKLLPGSVALALVVTVSACGSNNEEGSISNDGQQLSKLRLLGPANTSRFIKFDDREKYPVWTELDKMLTHAGLDPDYELVPNEQYSVVIKTRMASGSKLPDIVNISALDNTTVLNLAKQGALLDLNPLIEKYSNGNIKKMYDEEFPFAKKTTTSPDGKMYWFSSLHKKLYQDKQPAPVSLTMLIRKDWLDKLNLPVPATAEEYLQTLKIMRDKDANGNGQKDEVLLYNPGAFSESIAQWFGLGTGITAVDVENKKIVSPWYQDGVQDYFKYLQRMVKEGVLDTNLIAANSEQTQQKMIENKISSFNNYNLEMWSELNVQSGGSYLPLMPLKAVDSITPAIQIEPPYLVWEKYAITKDAKDVEAAIKFFDVVYSKEYADLLYWGIKDQTYNLDANGAKTFMNNGSDQELADKKQVQGALLFGGTVFPRIQFPNLEFELSRVPQQKADNEMKVLTYKPYYVSSNDNYLSIPDEKQLETKTKLLTNLTTYSTELATKLALGQSSLDDWDKYIAELKKLGLDQLIEIEQQLLDRYNSID